MSRNGSEVLLDALKANGTECLFGIPGTLTLPVYDALIDLPEITPIVTRHEQGAGFAADGYAKVSGRTGVVFTVPGPGGTNIATALQSAREDAVPLVAVTAGLADAMRNRSAIHDVDMTVALEHVVKRVIVPNTVAEIGPAVNAAFQWAHAGRPGPVQVVMKANLFREKEERVITQPRFEGPPDPPALDEAALDRAAEMLRAAKRPVLYVGFGVVAAGAEREVQLLAAKLGAPVVPSIKGRGVLSDRDPLCMGLVHFVGCEDLLRECDACLAVGTGFGQFSTFYFKAPIPKGLIQIDIDPERLGRNYPAQIGVQADAKRALQGILKRLEDMDDQPPGEGHFRVRSARALYAERLAGFLNEPAKPPFHGLFVMHTLRDVFPPETIFVSDSSATQSWLLEQAFDVHRPRTLLLSEAYQSMGYAVSAAIGARLGAPERPVCAVIGDGSFTMVCGELASAIALGLDITYLIFDDGEYNALRHSQKHVFNERFIGTSLNDPDFVALAEAFGAQARRVESAEGLREALVWARDGKGVHLIDCPIDRDVLSTRWGRAVKSFTTGAATATPGSA